MRTAGLFFALLILALVASDGVRSPSGDCFADDPPPPRQPVAPPPTEENREVFSGKVVRLQAALTRRGIKSRDEIKDQVVLETAEGELWPLVPDWRGRAFFQDERLRDRQVDLVCRRTPGIPYLQVLSVYTFSEEGECEYTDYWCDICSIPMYEIKDCDCCRGEIRLRFQPQKLPAYARPYKSSLPPAPKTP